MKPFTHILEPDLEQLVLQKPFSELSLEEKAIVLTEVSEREYTRLREFTLTTQAYFQQREPALTPRPETREILLNHMASRQESKVRLMLTNLVNYPIPAWQVAASMGLLVIALFFGQNHTMIQPGGGPHHIIVDSAHVDSSLQPHFHPNEDTMVHLTTMLLEEEEVSNTPLPNQRKREMEQIRQGTRRVSPFPNRIQSDPRIVRHAHRLDSWV